MSTCCIRPTSTVARQRRRRAARPRSAPACPGGRSRRPRSRRRTDRPSRGRNASCSEIGARLVEEILDQRRQPPDLRARERQIAGRTGWPASSCRSASCSVIASGPSAFLISCAAAASDTDRRPRRSASLAANARRFVMRARRWRRSPARRRCTSSPARSGRAGGRARARASSRAARPRSRADGRGRWRRR